MTHEVNKLTQRQATHHQRAGAPPSEASVEVPMGPYGGEGRRRGLWNAMRMLRSDARFSSPFSVFVLVLFFLCLALIMICAQLLDSSRGSLVGAELPNVMEDDVMMRLLQLYELAHETKSKAHQREFSRYLAKYKQMVECQSTTKGGGGGAASSGVGGAPDCDLALLPKYAAESRVELAGVLEKLREKIALITAGPRPTEELERAAIFVEREFERTSSLGGGAAKVMREREAFEPFDDILYLQLSLHYASAENDAPASSPSPGLDWWRRAKETAPSVYTGRFYYPLRRYHRMQSFSSEAPDATASWFDAIVDDLYGDTVTHFSPPKASAEYMASVPKLLRDGDAASLRLDSPAHTGSLFVNIASFRDRNCWPGVEQMMRRASNMFRVYLGIAQQNAESDPPCVAYELLEPHSCIVAPATRNVMGVDATYSGAVCFPADNIRMRQVRSSVAKGPTYGRYVAMLLYRGEDYALVIDSHTRFVYAWDARVAAMHVALQHPRAVLSHYPLAYKEKEGPKFRWERPSIYYLCRAHFLDRLGFVGLGAFAFRNPKRYADNVRYLKPYVVRGLHLRPNVDRPFPQPWVAGGFLFANASIMREVPFDPHLPYVFDGEEVMYGVRLWTHGYDLHSPRRSLFFHIYGRKTEPKVWKLSREWSKTQNISVRRIQYFLQVRVRGMDVLRIPKDTRETTVMIDADRYGTGRLRWVEDWYEFAGVDPVNYSLDGRWCGPDPNGPKLSNVSLPVTAMR